MDNFRGVVAVVGRLVGMLPKVVTRKQALERLSASALRHKLKRGVWQTVFRGVYVQHTGQISYRERLLAAVLARGDGARVSLECALHLWDLIDREPPIITLAEPEDVHRTRRLPGVRVTRRCRLTRAKRYTIPVTALPQTIIDVAALPHYGLGEVISLVSRAVRKKKLTVSDLREELAHHPRHPLRAQLDEVLTAADEGLESVAELRYVERVERAHGLPPMERQVPLDGPGAVRDGRSRRLDFRDRERGVGVEVDGEFYHRDRHHEDRARDREAAGRGDVILRAGWVDVVSTPCELAVDVALAQRARGWTGTPIPCSPDCAVGKDSRLWAGAA